MNIVQIVGYKNSGKTTLVSELVEKLSKAGFDIATLKHHGHGGLPDRPNNDSEKHRQAGATVAGVEGDGLFLLSVQKATWTVNQILAFYQLMKIDILFIEGYKSLDYPKIVLLRSSEDLPLLTRLSNIIACISYNELELDGYEFPVFPQQSINTLDPRLIDLILKTN